MTEFENVKRWKQNKDHIDYLTKQIVDNQKQLKREQDDLEKLEKNILTPFNSTPNTAHYVIDQTLIILTSGRIIEQEIKEIGSNRPRSIAVGE